MTPSPSSQICAAHEDLIVAVAAALAENRMTESAQALITQYREDGWLSLSHLLDSWLHGAEPATDTLDEEDQHIIQGILLARSDPDWLVTLADQARAQAALGIAKLIIAATWGDQSALDLLSALREAATDAGLPGSAAHAFVAIVEGARELDALRIHYPQADSLLLAAVLQQVVAEEAE